ncbi:MAG: RnfABCDGE type electron transport complex subunit D [Proteobacteria bacterium]|nr:RnfABCDGE type electron transport complex subunit D [Pseudomonadota bacterium]
MTLHNILDPHLDIQSAPHIPTNNSVRKIMFTVLIALLPAIAAHIYFFGIGIVLQIVLSVVFALIFESISLKLLKKPIRLFLKDLSAIVTGVLFALCISPIAPWWISCIGMFFAIVIAKHLYGGLGQNIFNPAMVGFAIVLISFPQSMSVWLAPQAISSHALSVFDTIQIIFFNNFSANIDYDTLTQATPLDAIKSGIMQEYAISEITTQAIFGNFGGVGWEWVANFYFLGGIFLIYKKIITWRIPVAIFATTILISLPFNYYDADKFISPLQHIFSGGLMLAAFFIATDPSSGCSSPKGQFIFAIGVAVMVVLVREFGNFPDGVAFGVLLMNLAAPLIDRLTIPKSLGQNIDE